MPRLNEQVMNDAIRRRLEEDGVLDALREHSRRNVEQGKTAIIGGKQASVRSGSVNDERLNGGRTTLIPFLWDGREVGVEEAIERAVESGIQWPAFDSHEEATSLSIELSNSLGRSDFE